jgi:hypothetical protein
MLSLEINDQEGKGLIMDERSSQVLAVHFDETHGTLWNHYCTVVM